MALLAGFLVISHGQGKCHVFCFSGVICLSQPQPQKMSFNPDLLLAAFSNAGFTTPANTSSLQPSGMYAFPACSLQPIIILTTVESPQT